MKKVIAGVMVIGCVGFGCTYSQKDLTVNFNESPGIESLSQNEIKYKTDSLTAKQTGNAKQVIIISSDPVAADKQHKISDILGNNQADLGIVP